MGSESGQVGALEGTFSELPMRKQTSSDLALENPRQYRLWRVPSYLTTGALPRHLAGGRAGNAGAAPSGGVPNN